jgi:hypothetical protein
MTNIFTMKILKNKDVTMGNGRALLTAASGKLHIHMIE